MLDWQRRAPMGILTYSTPQLLGNTSLERMARNIYGGEVLLKRVMAWKYKVKFYHLTTLRYMNLGKSLNLPCLFICKSRCLGKKAVYVL